MHRKKQTAAVSWSLFPDEAFATPEPAETVQAPQVPDSNQHQNSQQSNKLIDAPMIHGHDEKHTDATTSRESQNAVAAKPNDHDDKHTDAPNTRESQHTDIPKTYDHSELFRRLSQSAFRSRFHLSEKDKAYAREKGRDTLRRHAADFIAKRLAPAIIPNDGKQTPMRGHPVFRAQHATGCCCRGCFYKWHHIPPGRALTAAEQEYAVSVLMAWIDREMNAPEKTGNHTEPDRSAPTNGKPTA